MTPSRIHRNQQGVGLIEILIVLLVLGIGVLAVAGLQGDLMSDSSLTKARDEARELGRQGIEQLRSYIEKDRFEADLVATTSDCSGEVYTADPRGAIVGVNATFTREWRIVDDTICNVTGNGLSNAKEIIMKVGWTEPDGESQQVLLNSLISFSDPAKSGTLSTGGHGETGTLAKGPRLTGIEGMEEGTEDDPRDGSEDPPEGTWDDVDVHMRWNSRGHLELYKIDASGQAEVVLTVFGGKILTFTGTIYHRETDLPETEAIGAIDVSASSPSYCEFPIATDNSGSIRTSRYVCFAAGDCSNGGDACTITPSQEINGGWYGSIGLLGVDLNPFDTVCLGDTTAGQGTPAREYVTRRVTANATSSEGINTSYACHNFLIARPGGGETCASVTAGAGVRLAPGDIIRTLNDYAVNDVQPENRDYCTIAISGSIEQYAAGGGVVDSLVLSGDNGEICAVNAGSKSGTYTCTVPYASSGTIIFSMEVGVSGTPVIGDPSACSAEGPLTCATDGSGFDYDVTGVAAQQLLGPTIYIN